MTKKIKIYIIGSSVILGLTLGRIFGHSLIQYYWDWVYSSTTNNVTKEQITQYIKNSQLYPMYFDSFIIQNDKYGKFYYPKTIHRQQFIFYNPYLNKYFTYATIEWDIVLEEHFASIKETPFMGKVNIDEMNSGKGNSIDDPILVWKIELDSTTISIKDPWQERIYKRSLWTDEQYRGTVQHYLKYFVPKEEFEKTFPKKE